MAFIIPLPLGTALRAPFVTSTSTPAPTPAHAPRPAPHAAAMSAAVPPVSPASPPPPQPYAPAVMTLENEGAYAVMAAAAAVEASTGKHVVHLEIGQPAFDTPDHIAEAGIAAIAGGNTRYAAPRGTPALRDSIASWMRRSRALHVAADEVVVGPGAKPGLFFTTAALVRGPADEVVIPDPGFPTYRAMAEVAGATVVPVRLRPDMRSLDMDLFERAVSERTRLVVLNSPGNPTGGVMPKEDVERMAALAQKHDFWVISDEIYSQLCYEEDYTSIASLPGMRERTVVVDGLSKSHCMTGWRLGWAVMPRELAARVELLLVHSVGCTAAFVQAAGVAALEGPDGGVGKRRAEFRRRRDLVVKGLNAMRGVRCAAPQGAFYAFADVSAFGRSSAEVADALLQAGLVAVLPGSDFGAGGEGFIRISYVAEESELREGLRRIAQVLSNWEVVPSAS